MITAETARDIMLTHPVGARENETMQEVLRHMVAGNVKELPILDADDRVIGDLTILDLLKFIVASKSVRQTIPPS